MLAELVMAPLCKDMSIDAGMAVMYKVMSNIFEWNESICNGSEGYTNL